MFIDLSLPNSTRGSEGRSETGLVHIKSRPGPPNRVINLIGFVSYKYFTRTE